MCVLPCASIALAGLLGRPRRDLGIDPTATALAFAPTEGRQEGRGHQNDGRLRWRGGTKRIVTSKGLGSCCKVAR